MSCTFIFFVLVGAKGEEGLVGVDERGGRESWVVGVNERMKGLSLSLSHLKLPCTQAPVQAKGGAFRVD